MDPCGTRAGTPGSRVGSRPGGAARSRRVTRREEEERTTSKGPRVSPLTTGLTTGQRREGAPRRGLSTPPLVDGSVRCRSTFAAEPTGTPGTPRAWEPTGTRGTPRASPRLPPWPPPPPRTRAGTRRRWDDMFRMNRQQLEQAARRVPRRLARSGAQGVPDATPPRGEVDLRATKGEAAQEGREGENVGHPRRGWRPGERLAGANGVADAGVDGAAEKTGTAPPPDTAEAALALAGAPGLSYQ